MGDTGSQTVLGRIAAAASQERKAKAMTLQKALRLCVAKVADALMDLPAALIGVVVQTVGGDTIEAALDDSALLLLLDGPAGCTGAAVLDQVVVGGLIQQQTIGTVLADAGQTRTMTRTDAAICAPLIDGLIARVAPILDDANDRALIDGFRFGAKADDPRTLAMALDLAEYVSIKLTVDIARGVRQGEITLILPCPDARTEAFPPDAESSEAVPPAPDLTKTVMGLNAELDMVLCNVRLPLSALRALKVGQSVPLTPGAFPNVQIMTRTGRILGRGVVGHVDGVRAVKPSRPPSHATQPLRRSSDQPLVDMPEVEVLTSTGRRMTLAREVEVTEADTEEAMHALERDDDMPGVPQLPSGPVNDRRERAEPPAVSQPPDPIDLPDLDDFPDLADMPEFALKSAG